MGIEGVTVHGLIRIRFRAFVDYYQRADELVPHRGRSSRLLDPETKHYDFCVRGPFKRYTLS